MSSERAAMLERIRAALQTAHLPGARSSVPAPALPASAEPAQLVESFIRELKTVGGQVLGPLAPAKAAESVIQLLQPADGKELLAWADEALPVAGLGLALRAAGYTLLDPAVPGDIDGRRAAQARLASAAAGLTGAQAGLADTGSLLLITGAGRPRMASLLPPLHIALLRTADLYATLPACFAAQPDLARGSSNVVLITGPSRTGDIELNLVFGVHGPKAVAVVLIEAEAAA